MGRQSHKSAPYMCGACKKGFGGEIAVRDHIRDVHPKASGVGVFRCIDRVNGPEHDDEPSYADRAIAAQLDIAMGVPTDDAWLVEGDC